MLFSLLCTLACSTAKTDSAVISVDISSCDTPLPVIDWSASGMPTEGIEGIEDELAALDLSVLEDPVDISTIMPMFRGIIAYALEIPPSELPNTLTHEQALQQGSLGEVVLGSLLLGKEDPTGIDFSFFRRGFHRYYTCSRGFPTSLAAFQEVYGPYESGSGNTVDSIAKCGDRRLIHPTQNVYIAESLVEENIRETEILLANNRSDGQLDFLVYDAQGQLTNRTQFPTLNNGPHVVTSAPYACMTCHMNPDSAPNTWGYDVLMPSAGPCQ